MEGGEYLISTQDHCHDLHSIILTHILLPTAVDVSTYSPAGNGQSKMSAVSMGMRNKLTILLGVLICLPLLMMGLP